jgi:putative ABC transport system permease protein
MAFLLAFKEIWRNKGRFFLFSLVITLITTLVLFIAALAEGLAEANKQYLEEINAELLAFQQNVQLSVATSRIGFSKLNDIERVDGVQAAGPVGLSSGTLVFPDGREDLNVSLIGLEAGKPGMPAIVEGDGLLINRGSDVVIDKNVADRAGVRMGDQITIKTIQGTKEQFYPLNVVGVAEKSQYLFQPSIFLPYRTWDQIRPQGGAGSPLVETISNMVAVQLKPGFAENQVAQNIANQVRDLEVVDVKTAYESLPGYQAQQSTLNTQRGFTLLIGVLVIGGFFQIQMLQKVPQIGVLKAIGTSNLIIATAVVAQIVLVTTFGVLLGVITTLALAAGIPSSVPVVFNGPSVAIAIVTLLAIGPIGGLVSVRLAVSVEPLIALGLSS